MCIHLISVSFDLFLSVSLPLCVYDRLIIFWSKKVKWDVTNGWNKAHNTNKQHHTEQVCLLLVARKCIFFLLDCGTPMPFKWEMICFICCHDMLIVVDLFKMCPLPFDRIGCESGIFSLQAQSWTVSISFEQSVFIFCFLQLVASSIYLFNYCQLNGSEKMAFLCAHEFIKTFIVHYHCRWHCERKRIEETLCQWKFECERERNKCAAIIGL